MDTDYRPLIEQYVNWLRDKTQIKKVENDWVEITTPFLDRHNDYLQIYVRKEADNFILTDDSSTIEDLRLSGCELNTPKRKKLLELTLNGFGVGLDNDALLVKASGHDFAQKKHDLIQAILAVNDMFFLAAPTVTSLFFEDVSSWLDENNVRYTPRVRFSGLTGFVHNFDFVIPKSTQAPERVIQLINRPNRHTAEKVAFTWIDTRESRPQSTAAYAFLNDTTRIVGLDEIKEAMKKYDINPVSWSERDNVKQALIA